MPDVIKLEFRRGGEWLMTTGLWFIRAPVRERINTYDVRNSEETAPTLEYAGPFTLEIVEPDPEPLRIEGYELPCVRETSAGHALSIESIWLVTAGLQNCSSICVHGSTRREAIERYNILARAMGATE